MCISDNEKHFPCHGARGCMHPSCAYLRGLSCHNVIGSASTISMISFMLQDLRMHFVAVIICFRCSNGMILVDMATRLPLHKIKLDVPLHQASRTVISWNMNCSGRSSWSKHTKNNRQNPKPQNRKLQAIDMGKSVCTGTPVRLFIRVCLSQCHLFRIC